MTSYGYLFLRPEGQDSLSCLHFDNYDYFEGPLDERGRFTSQGVYNSYSKNEQQVLSFQQGLALFMNMPVLQNL